jgi:GT2 family glycosyltransferase
VENFPKISVIIPCLNSASTITELINSILTQRICNLIQEVLVIDNGSTDDTAKKASQFPVRVLNCPKRGAGAARNFGASFATGSWLLFLDSDTVLEEGFFEAILPCLQERRSTVILGPVITATRKERFLDNYRKELRFFQTAGSFMSSQGPGGPRPDINSAAFIISKRVFRLLGGFDESFLRCEDSEFSVRAFCFGASLESCPRARVSVVYSGNYFDYLFRFARNGFYSARLHRLRGGEDHTQFGYGLQAAFSSPSLWAFHCLVCLFGTLGKVCFILFGDHLRSWNLAPAIEDLVRKATVFSIEGQTYHLKPPYRVTFDDQSIHVFDFRSKTWVLKVPLATGGLELLKQGLLEESA